MPDVSPAFLSQNVWKQPKVECNFPSIAIHSGLQQEDAWPDLVYGHCNLLSGSVRSSQSVLD